MKLSPVSEKKIRGWTVQNFEESFPECSAVAHEWADFLIKNSGKSPFSKEYIEGESRFLPSCYFCQFLPDGLVFAEQAFARAIYAEWLCSTDEYKAFVTKINSLKYENPKIILENPDFYSFEQKMEAQDVLSNGYYRRRRQWEYPSLS